MDTIKEPSWSRIWLTKVSTADDCCDKSDDVDDDDDDDNLI